MEGNRPSRTRDDWMLILAIVMIVVGQTLVVVGSFLNMIAHS